MQCSYTASGRSILFLALSLTVCFAAACKKKTPPPPPPEVQVSTLTATNVPIFEEWIGTLDGSVNAQIHAQVTGYLLSQNYAEGSEVKKGDLLFQIDPRPFQAMLDQAKARLAQDQAQADKAKLDVKRDAPLAKEQAISQEQMDDAVQAGQAANAQVKADQASVESARLNLGFTKVLSPVDGLAGLANAQIGDLVSQSSSVLTTVSTINPIKVYFQVSEQSYRTFWYHFTKATNTDDVPLRLVFSDDTTYPQPGRFFFADRQVNPETGTLQIAGLFSNADFILRPGQYARVRVQTHTRTNAILVPQRAVAELQGSYQVVVVDDQKKSHIRNVKVSDQIGDSWIVDSGLKPGESIVVEGTQKAKEGTVVDPKPYGSTNQTNQTDQASSPTNSTSAKSSP